MQTSRPHLLRRAAELLLAFLLIGFSFLVFCLVGEESEARQRPTDTLADKIRKATDNLLSY